MFEQWQAEDFNMQFYSLSLVKEIFKHVSYGSHTVFKMCKIYIFFHSSLWTLLQMWLEEFSEDFRDPPMHSSLRLMSLQLRRYTALFPLAKRYEALLKRFQAEGYYLFHIALKTAVNIYLQIPCTPDSLLHII